MFLKEPKMKTISTLYHWVGGCSADSTLHNDNYCNLQIVWQIDHLEKGIKPSKLWNWNLSSIEFVHESLSISAVCNRICLNLLLHNNPFWRFWNIMYSKIICKMEHLLHWSKCSILHIFKSIQNFTLSFAILSKIEMIPWSKNGQWS